MNNTERILNEFKKTDPTARILTNEEEMVRWAICESCEEYIVHFDVCKLKNDTFPLATGHRISCVTCPKGLW